MSHEEFLPHLIQQIEVRQCASQRGCSPDSTCQWPGRRGCREAPPATGRTATGCTGRSETGKTAIRFRDTRGNEKQEPTGPKPLEKGSDP